MALSGVLISWLMLRETQISVDPTPLLDLLLPSISAHSVHGPIYHAKIPDNIFTIIVSNNKGAFGANNVILGK